MATAVRTCRQNGYFIPSPSPNDVLQKSRTEDRAVRVHPRQSPDCRRVGNRDRKSVVSGKSVSVRVDIGGRRILKKKRSSKQYKNEHMPHKRKQNQNARYIIKEH